MTGRESNDEFTIKNDTIFVELNSSGGIQGGISNGMEIYFDVIFKAISSIPYPQIVGPQLESLYGVEACCGHKAQISVGNAEVPVGSPDARRVCCCVVLGSPTFSHASLIHPSLELDRRRPREAPVAFSSHPARVGW